MRSNPGIPDEHHQILKAKLGRGKGNDDDYVEYEKMVKYEKGAVIFVVVLLSVQSPVVVSNPHYTMDWIDHDPKQTRAWYRFRGGGVEYGTFRIYPVHGGGK